MHKPGLSCESEASFGDVASAGDAGGLDDLGEEESSAAGFVLFLLELFPKPRSSASGSSSIGWTDMERGVELYEVLRDGLNVSALSMLDVKLDESSVWVTLWNVGVVASVPTSFAEEL